MKSQLCFAGAGFHATTNIYPVAVEAGADIQAVATRHLERETCDGVDKVRSSLQCPG